MSLNFGVLVSRVAAGLFVLRGAVGCVSAPLPPDDGLSAIVADVRAGRIDVCRDMRWPSWRFDYGDKGKARLDRLRALAAAEQKALDPEAAGDAFAWAAQRGRLVGLQAILRAALFGGSTANWHEAFAAQELLLRERREIAGRIKGQSIAAVAARHALWRRVRSELGNGAKARDFRGTRIAMCLIAEDEARAEMESAQAVMAALDRDYWPSDGADGDGATREVLELRSVDIGGVYLKRNIARLDAAATRGAIPIGGWLYLRAGQAKETNPMMLVSRVTLFRKFLEELQPPRTIGEELYRRGRVDQLAINAELSMINDYKPTRARDRAEVRLKAIADGIVKENSERLKVLLRDREWFDDENDGEGAEVNAWLIVQHADHDRAFQSDVLRRMEPLVAAGRMSPIHYAYLWDRVAEGQKRPQRYATQVECKGGKWVARIGLEDPEHLDDRRLQIGLGLWKDYADSFGKCP